MIQRISPRVTLLAPVFFKTQNLSEYWGRFRDISPYGAKLITRNPMSEGDAIVFDMALPCGNVISSVPAEVVWTKPDGFYVVCGLAISGGLAAEVILKGLKALLLSQKEDYIKARSRNTISPTP